MSDPSVIATTQPRYGSVADAASVNLTQIGITAAVAIILAILIALPTALLESTLEENHGRIAQWFKDRFVRKVAPAQSSSEGESNE